MNGAHDRNRTCDLFLTKEVLYRLSYMSKVSAILHDGKEQTSIHAGELFLPSSMTAKIRPTSCRTFHKSVDSTGRTAAEQWSGRRESNPRNQFGKLMFYH
jgi:hypothetical protein